MDEPTLEQSVEYLMRQAPVPVQNFILTKLSDVVLDLMVTHALHVDQAGVLKSELLLMLVGQVEPAEFSQNLQESGVSPEVTRAIMTDVNEMVFKKLREEERADVASVQAAPLKPQVPVMGIEIKEAVPPNPPGQYTAPQPTYQAPPIPAPAPAPVFPQPIAPPPYMAQAPTYQAPTPVPIPAAPVPNVPIYSNPPPPQTVARTMESDMELAAQGFRPGSESQVQPPAPLPYIPQAQPTPAAYVPAPTPQPPPVYAAPVPPPQSVYVASTPPPPPPAPQLSYPPPAMASVRLTPVDRTHANAPITKEYGSDPYREPIE